MRYHPSHPRPRPPPPLPEVLVTLAYDTTHHNHPPYIRKCAARRLVAYITIGTGL